jgi:hypothetical protein
MTAHSKNNNHQNGTSHSPIACVSPAIGAKLPDYIVDLLDDEAAFAIEQHLGQCELCKERYLLMLRVRSEAPERVEVAAPNNGAGLSNDSVDSLEATNH